MNTMEETIQTKVCTKCKVEKELSQFYKHRSMKDGLQYKCIECCNRYSKERYHTNKDNPEFLKRQFEYNQRWLEKRMAGMGTSETVAQTH
jgi:hypothetical protein